MCIPDICTTKYNTIDVRCFLEEDEIDEETLENFTFVVEVSENLCKAILCLKKFGTKIAVILIVTVPNPGSKVLTLIGFGAEKHPLSDVTIFDSIFLQGVLSSIVATIGVSGGFHASSKKPLILQNPVPYKMQQNL